jgi:predicted permease
MRPPWCRRTEEDFSAELQAHLDLETDRLIADGSNPDEARHAARRTLGNVTAIRERFHDAGRWTWLEQAVQDLRYAARGLRRSPAFVATSVLTLAIGLGLATVVFTIFNAYVLRPFPIRDPSSLYQIAWRSQETGGSALRWRDYQDLRRRRDLFDAVIGESTRSVSSRGRPLTAALVSDNYFEALGPRMLLGRPLGSIEAGGGAMPAVVLSREAWTRLSGSDPAAIGRELDINGRPFLIVGVLREFTGLEDSPRDVWVPLAAYAALAAPDLIGPVQPRAIEISARLRPGVTAASAQGAITAMMADMVGGKEDVRAEVSPQESSNPLSLHMLALLTPVFAAFGLVLVTASANVSNVMLARAIARHREIAIRLSLGASRGRVVRQLLTEGLLIALLAGLVGVALAACVVRTATVTFFHTLPPSAAAFVRLVPIGIDHRVFLFSLGTAACATMLFALMPALQASRLSLTDALRGQEGDVRRGSLLRSALVTGQVAVSLVLVVVALTLARNGMAVGAIDLGYETRGVIAVNVRSPQADMVPRLASVLAADPRVAEVAVTARNPLFVRSRLVAAAPEQGAAAATRYTFVSPEYFSILRLPIARGRGFRPSEASAAAPVAIVSAATARAFWPGDDPIGRTIRIERPDRSAAPRRRVRSFASALRPGGQPANVDDLPAYSHVTVVGVVKDVVSGRMVDGPDAGHIYLPIGPASPHAVALLVRGRSERDFGPEAQQQLFQQVAGDPQLFDAVPLDERRALQMYPLLAVSWIGALLGSVALVLSVSGLYGVLAYLLGQRTREIGIRMALGATAGAVIGLVLRQSARLAGLGAIVGLAAAFSVMKVLSAVIQLEAVSVLDIGAFAGGLGLVIAAAAVAAYYPARRATRIDPAQTLRADG